MSISLSGRRGSVERWAITPRVGLAREFLVETKPVWASPKEWQEMFNRALYEELGKMINGKGR